MNQPQAGKPTAERIAAKFFGDGCWLEQWMQLPGEAECVRAFSRERFKELVVAVLTSSSPTTPGEE